MHLLYRRAQYRRTSLVKRWVRRTLTQQQREVLIHVQEAITGPVPLTADLVELLQQARDRLEVLEPLKLLFLDFVPLLVHSRQFR